MAMTVVKPRPYVLQNQIRHYAWGSRGEAAFIPLNQWIAAHTQEILGQAVAEKFSCTLPG